MALWINKPTTKSGSFENLSEYRNAEKLFSLIHQKLPIKNFKGIDNFNDLLNDTNSILLFHNDLKKTELDIIKKCNENNIPVICLHTLPQSLPTLKYDSVAEDYTVGMGMLLSYINNYGKIPAAFFSCSPDSAHDTCKISCLFELCPDFSNDDIFYRLASEEECFNNFYKQRYKYKTIICSNDFSAIDFLCRMNEMDPEYSKDRFIIGAMDSIFSRLYSTSITSFSGSLADKVSAIVNIYRMRSRHRTKFTELSVRTRGHITPRASTQFSPILPVTNNINFSTASTEKSPLNIPKMTDKDVSEYFETNSNLLSIETMLLNMDICDFKILYYFLLGHTNTDICNKLLISVKTVLYRSKKMFNALGCASKVEFIEVISPYISVDNLKNYINELEEQIS